MADWLNINSTNILSVCGETAGHDLAKALDGTDRWGHYYAVPHQFELDLFGNYLLSSVRGRSNTDFDPKLVDIYISQDKDDYGDPVLIDVGFTDTADWIEYSFPEKIGQYVKVVIKETETAWGDIVWGQEWDPFTIFDVYGEIAPGAPHYLGDAGWKLVSLPVNSTIAKTATFYLYNGTYYTFAQATTNDNETGAPLIMAMMFGWDFPTQLYTMNDDFVPYCGYWQYYYKSCQLYYPTLGTGPAGICVIPGKAISLDGI